MGGWSNQIGHYEVSQMDYYYEDIKEEEQTLEYYNSKTVQVKFNIAPNVFGLCVRWRLKT
jgi:hypothetical protein